MWRRLGEDRRGQEQQGQAAPQEGKGAARHRYPVYPEAVKTLAASLALAICLFAGTQPKPSAEAYATHARAAHAALGAELESNDTVSLTSLVTV